MISDYKHDSVFCIPVSRMRRRLPTGTSNQLHGTLEESWGLLHPQLFVQLHKTYHKYVDSRLILWIPMVSLSEGYGKIEARTVPRQRSLLLPSKSLVEQQHQPNTSGVS